MAYRHEQKQEISFGDMITLRQRLNAIMSRDSHAVNGTYKIRSLYFDNIADKALREKLNGVNYREKFRIRYYNNDTSVIHLEKKSKINGLSEKIMTELTYEQAKAIADGDYDWMMKSDIPLIQELYAKIMSQGLRPKTIVDYMREPFVYGPGNVRVTIDYDIRTGLYGTDFLNLQAVTMPVPSSPIILEIKWDEYLPDIIRSAVELNNCRTHAYSKYAACRAYC